MCDEVRDYVRRCFLCACYKNSNTTATTALRPHQPTKPWDTISVDLMGPYPRSSKGRRFILVATDMFSRWVDATRDIRIMEEEVFSRWGYHMRFSPTTVPNLSARLGRKLISAGRRSTGQLRSTIQGQTPRKGTIRQSKKDYAYSRRGTQKVGPSPPNHTVSAPQPSQCCHWLHSSTAASGT